MQIDVAALSLYVSIFAVLISIFAIVFSIKQARITTESNLTTLFYNQRNKYHNTLHEYWALSKDERNTQKWKKIMKLELQAYANIFEYACVKYFFHHIERKAFRETFNSSIIYFYEGNWGKEWGVDVQDETSTHYCYLRKVYKEFKGL